MKTILGFCVIAMGFIAAFVLGIIFLCYGVWDIFHNFDTLTFGQFVLDVCLILGREIIAIFIAIGCYIGGIALINSK